MELPRRAVLEEVAFQTNLVALSAAVEAAGAGEDEWGTAASELQRLAQTARRTARLIESSAPSAPPRSRPSSD